MFHEQHLTFKNVKRKKSVVSRTKSVKKKWNMVEVGGWGRKICMV